MTVDEEHMLRGLRALVEAETPSGDLQALQRGFGVLAELVVENAGRTPQVGTGRDGVPYLYLAPLVEPSILFVGHLDTVWPLGTLADIPFMVEGGVVRGPGVFDMKSGLMVALAAMATTSQSDHVGLLVTGDEEVGSVAGRELVERYGVRSDAVIVPEPAAPGGALKATRKGVGLYQFILDGRAAHAGLEPERGANTTVELAELVRDLVSLEDLRRGTTVTPTVVTSGTTVNTVPEKATLHADVRSWTTSELQRVDTAVRARRESVAGVTVQVSGGINRFPLEADASDRFVALALQVAQEVGLEPMGAVGVGGGSDGNFVGALGIPTLDGAGAVGGGAHARDEWVDIACLVPRARWLARVVERVVEVAQDGGWPSRGALRIG
jgi:glutamate carboxypeptidase